MNQALYNIAVDRIDGTPTRLASYENKVLLIVNVASKCGLTPQYEGLEKIYRRYQNQGFEVLGFPANEFAGQEPGTNQEIQEFCQMKFGVEFPMFSKIVVKGPGQHPLYQYLTHERPKATPNPQGVLKNKLKEKGLLNGDENEIMWNFEKFLVNRQGEVVERFAPDVPPEDPLITAAIERELAKKS